MVRKKRILTISGRAIPIVGITATLGLSSLVGLASLVGSAHAEDGYTQVAVSRDQLSLQIDSRCAFKTSAGTTDTGIEYNGTVDNRGEAVFDNNGKHNFNIACNQSSGYTVRAYATDLEKSDDSATTIPFTNYNNYNAYIAEHDGAAVWTAEVLDNNTIAGLTPQFGTSSTDTQIIKTTSGPSELTGDEFGVTYKAHVSQSTIPGTYSGTAVYTLLLNPYTPTTYRYIIRYHADGSPAVPQNQSGEALIADPITAVTLSNLSPIKDNYHLAGWRMSENGDSEIEAENQVYAPGSTFTITPTHSIVDLYAVWEENETAPDVWTLVYDANGGENAPNQVMVATMPNSDANITIASTIPTRASYRFFGWSTNPNSTNPDSGFERNETPTITLNESSPTITLYAVWKPVASLTYFQTVGTNQAEAQNWCKGLTIWTSSNNAEYTLYDSRDEKGFLVRRLADGNCWMVQNLALAGGQTITSANSNVSSDYPIPNSSTSGWSSDSGQYMWNGTKHLDATQNNKPTSNNTTSPDNTGAYYSFLVATAGTGTGSSGNASSSICPKWWHLPTAGSSGKEFETLKGKYSAGDSGFNAAFRTPSTAFTGYCDSKNCPGANSIASFWSASISNSTNSYSYYTYDSGTSSSLRDKNSGYSVRCMLSGN